MKKLTVLWFFCLFTFAFCHASYAGQWTAHGYFYKPSMGASGQTEYNLFNQGLDQADAELFALDPPPGLVATPPLTYNSTTGVISLPQASATVSGYLASGDWSTFNAKQPAISPGATSQYWRGDKTWQTLNPAAVGAAPATAGTSILKGNGSGGTTAAVANTDYAAVRDNGDPTYLWNGNYLLSRISDVWAGITGNLIVWGSNIYGTNLATVISTIGSSNPANLIIPPGTFSISSNVTVTPNIRLLPQNGALITIPSGDHLFINGPFEAGQYQVFNDLNPGLNGVQFVTPVPSSDQYWPFDAPKPQHLWNFALSQNYSDHGTTGGLTLAAQGSGNSFGPGGLILNGSGYASVANNSDVCNLSTGPYTIIFEFSYPAAGGGNGLLNGGRSTNSDGWYVTCPDSGNAITFHEGTNTILSTGDIIPFAPSPNTDYQVVVVYQGSGMPVMYINGVARAAAYGWATMVPGAGPFEVGGVVGYPNFKGTIKQVGILKGIACTPNQVNQIFNGKKTCPIEKVYSIWWGSARTDVPIQAAINSVPFDGHVWIPDGHYYVTHAIGALGPQNLTIEGQSKDGTILDASNSSALTLTGGATAPASEGINVTAINPLCPSGVLGTLFIDVDPTNTIQPTGITICNLTIKPVGGNINNQKTLGMVAASDVKIKTCYLFGGYWEDLYATQMAYLGYSHVQAPIMRHYRITDDVTFDGGYNYASGSPIQLNLGGSYDGLVDGCTFLNGSTGIDAACTGLRILNSYFLNMSNQAIVVNDTISPLPIIIASCHICGVGVPGQIGGATAILVNGQSEVHNVMINGVDIKDLYGNANAFTIFGNATVSNCDISRANDDLYISGNYPIINDVPVAFAIRDIATSSNIYLINDVVEKTTLSSKWLATIACGGTTNSPNTNLFVIGGSYDDVLSGGWALYDAGNGSTTTANITINGAILNGLVKGNRGTIASIVPSTNVPVFANNLGTTDLTLMNPALGTPVSGNLANCTFPTLNQNTTGTAANLSGNQTANYVYSGPSSGSAAPASFRALAAADIPTLNQNTTGTATYAANLTGSTIGSIPYQSGSGATGYLTDVATGAPLISGGTGSAPAYANYTFSGTSGDTYTFPATSKTLMANDFSNIGGSATTGYVLTGNGTGSAPSYQQLAASNLSNGTTGSGDVVLATSPTLTTPALGTPVSGNLSNCTNLPVGANYQLSGTTSYSAAGSSTSYTMTGISGSFTPTKSGNALIIVSGTLIDASGGTAAGVGVKWQLSYGTGTAPSNGGSLKGTQVGPAYEYTNPGSGTVTATDVHQPFVASAVVTGLTVNTAYWIDLAQEAATSAYDVSFDNVGISALEQ